MPEGADFGVDLVMQLRDEADVDERVRKQNEAILKPAPVLPNQRTLEKGAMAAASDTPLSGDQLIDWNKIDFSGDQKSPLHDGPYPMNVDAAVAQAAKDGLNHRFSAQEYDDIAKHADLLLVRGLQRTGLDHLPHGMKQLMQRALTYNMVKYYAPLGDAERTEVIRQSGGKLLGKAMDALDHRLRTLEPHDAIEFGNRPTQTRKIDYQSRQRYEQAFALLKSWKSRLETGDPRADLVTRQLYSRYTDWKLEHDRLQQAEMAGVQHELSRITENSLVSHTYDDGKVHLRAGRSPNLHKYQDSMAEMWGAIQTALKDTENPYAPENALALSLRGSVKQARLRGMGLTEDEIHRTGLFGTLMKTHPQLIAEAFNLENKRAHAQAEEYAQRSDQVLSWEQKQKMTASNLYHFLYKLESIGAPNENAALAALESRQITGAETDEEFKGKVVDQLKGNFGRVMLNAMGAVHTLSGKAVDAYRHIRENDKTAFDVTGKAAAVLTLGMGTDALKSLDDTAGVDAEKYGMGRESRLSTDIIEGVEKGEISKEALARVLGDDKFATTVFWGVINDLAEQGPHKVLSQRLQRWGGAKLHPEALAELGAQMREDFTNITVTPPGFKSLAELEDWYSVRMHQASAMIRNGQVAEGRALAFSTSVVDQLFTGMWELGGFLAKDPETVGVLAVASYFGGKQLAKVGEKLGVDKMAVRMTHHTRLRKSLKDLIAHDPFYADTIKSYVQKHSPEFMRKGVLSEERLREFDGIMRTFADDSMLDGNRLANLTKTDIDLMKKKRADPRTWRHLDRDLREFDHSTLENMLDLDAKGAEYVKYLRDPVRLSPVVSFIEDVMERTGYARRRFNPRMRARAQNILRKVTNMIDGGASIERFKSILYPFSGAVGPDKQSIWARLVRRYPQLSKSFTVLDAAKTSLLMKGAKLLQDVLPTLTALRDHNNVVMGRQHRLVRVLQNKHAGRAADYSSSRFANGLDDLTDVERTELVRLDKTQARLKELDGQVKVRNWRKPVRLSRHPDVVENTSVGELRTLIELEEPMAQHRLWSMLRKEGETIDKFTARWNQTIAEETDFLNSKAVPAGMDEATLRKKLRKAKRDLLEAYYDQDDLQNLARMDLAEPDKPTFRPFKETEKILAERKAIAAKASKAREHTGARSELSAEHWEALRKADERPDLYSAEQDYGLQTVQAGEGWNNLKRWAETFDAEKVAYIRDAAPMLDPGEMTSFLAHVSQGGQEMRNHFHYFSMRNQKNAEVYRKMSPDQRKAFDQAIEKLADGEGKDWNDLMEKNPELAAAWGEGPAAKVVERMWGDNEEMREMLMDWAHKAGMVDDDVHDYFMKYYAPHRYKLFTWRELNPRWWKKAAHDVIENHPENKLAEFEEFARQRDHHRVKVLVKRDGGVWIKRKFDTREDALRWADENVGLRTKKDAEGADYQIEERLRSAVDGKEFGHRYKSFMDDDVVVMDPIGEEMLDYLRPQPAGENLFERMGKLSRDVAFYNYLKMFDRPGWVVERKAFKDMSVEMRKNWVEIPSGANGWGPFKGRYMHRRLAKRIQDYVEIDSALQAMKGEMAKVVQESWTHGSMMWLHKGLSALGGSARFFKRIIANSRVMRNIRTITGNVIWDKQKTARAVDPSYLTDPKGREFARTAYRILLGAEGWLGQGAADPKIATTLKRIVEKGSVRKGGWFDPSTPIDPDAVPFLQEAVRHGIIGDTPLGSHLSGKDRALVLELQYGSGLAKPLRQRLAKGATKIPGGEAAKEAYNKLMKRLGFNEGESVGELIGKYFTGTHDHEGSMLRKEIAELDRLLDDVGAGRREIPTDRVMELEYERASKSLALKSVGDESAKGVMTDLLSGLGYLTGAKSSYGRFGTMNNWSHDFYQRLGNVHKLGVYLHMRAKGVPEEVALARIRNFMQNYNNLPSWIRSIQRSDLASVANPIFSFGYEFWRIQKNLMLHHPEVLGATWAIAPALSFMSCAANGVNVADLWRVEARNEGGFDAFTNAVRTLYLPTPDGGYSTHRLTYMDEFAVLNKPTGVLGNVVDNAKEHGNVITEIMARGAAPFFLENLQTNAAYSVLTGQDPLTQKKLEGGSVGTAASAARQIMRMAQPGWVPWSGDFHDMLDTYRRPPTLRTRFMVEASEKLLQIMGGYRTRGGFWSQIADGTTNLRCSEHVNNLLLHTASVGEKFDLPLRALGAATDKRMAVGAEASIPASPLRARGFTDRDIFTTLFYANAKYGVDYENTGRDGVQNFAQDDMFNAAHLIEEGRKRGDENMVGVGIQLRDGAIERIKSRMDAQEKYAELREIDPDAYNELVDDRILKAARNAAQNMDMTYAFNRGSLRQKVVTLVEASALGLDDELIDEAASVMMYTTRFNFAHSMDFNNAAQLRTAMVDLEEHLNNPGRGATGMGALGTLYEKMSQALPDVIQRDALKVFNQEIQARAFDLLEEEVRE